MALREECDGTCYSQLNIQSLNSNSSHSQMKVTRTLCPHFVVQGGVIILTMLKFMKRKVLHTWIAMLAILFSALAPTVSHALAASTSSVLAEMCSVDGVKLVTADRKAPAKSMQGMEHCSYCVTHGGSFGLPPSAAQSFAVVSGHDSYPALFYSAPQPLHTWSAASPRAPPAVS